MENQNVEVYRTGQGVPVKAEYTCQSGERLTLNENEEFPVCPVSGKDTTWRQGDFDFPVK